MPYRVNGGRVSFLQSRVCTDYRKPRTHIVNFFIRIRFTNFFSRSVVSGVSFEDVKLPYLIGFCEFWYRIGTERVFYHMTKSYTETIKFYVVFSISCIAGLYDGFYKYR